MASRLQLRQKLVRGGGLIGLKVIMSLTRHWHRDTTGPTPSDVSDFLLYDNGVRYLAVKSVSWEGGHYIRPLLDPRGDRSPCILQLYTFTEWTTGMNADVKHFAVETRNQRMPFKLAYKT